MKRGHGFVYSTSAGGGSGQQTQAFRSGERKSQFMMGENPSNASPRKRQRSLEAAPFTIFPRNTRGGYDTRQGRSDSGSNDAIVSSAAKLVKRNDDDLSFGEDDNNDDIDALGTAALEEFELTQQPASSPQPASITNVVASSIVFDSYKPQPAPKFVPYPTQEKVLNVMGATTPSQATQYQNDEYKEKIQRLQEQNYTKDGEVKVLRSEKERLLGELRKKDQLVHDLQTELLLEKQAKAEEFSKEKQSLTSRLHFKEQELVALREKCSLLEQTHKNLSSNTNTPSPLPKQMQPPLSSSISSMKARPYHQTPTTSKNSRTEFLSTETFMPISQVSDVTPVRLGQKRPAQGGRDEEPSLTKEVKQEERKGSRSSSSSPSTSTVPSKKIEPKNHARIRSSNSETQSTIDTQSSHRDECAPVLINVPKKQLDGAQLLMLLIKHDLGRAPSYIPRPASSVGDSSSENSENSQSTVDSLCSFSEGKRLTGLLSLLHLEEKTPTFLPLFPNVLKTPVHTVQSSDSYSRQPSLESYRPIPALNPGLANSPVAGPNTPIRKSRLHLKPHTCARTDVTRGRMRAPINAITPIRSLSEANTPIPYRGVTESVSASLVSSVDKRELEQSIAGLLHFTDCSKASTSYSKRNCDDANFGRFLSVSLMSARSLQDPVLRLLNQIGDLIIRYHNEQSSKVKALANMSSHFMADVSDIADISNVGTPKSSLSSTTSSKGSSDFISPLEGDQKLASQALEILETLVLYSEKVREQILIRPPEFVIDSRPCSSLGVHQVTPNVTTDSSMTSQSSLNDSSTVGKKLKLSTKRGVGSPTISNLVQVAHRLTSLQVEESPSDVLTPQKVKEWKKQKLINYKTFHKVWSTQQSTDDVSLQNGDSSQPFTPAVRTPAIVHGSGQLFSVLLDLPVPSWRESVENTTTCLRILAILAHHCPIGNLSWFSSLLQEDKLGVCLDKEDPNLTLVVLKLLTSLVHSPDVANELCRHGDPCIPITCYQCLVDPPTGPPSSERNLDIIFKIRLQILRFVSNILVLTNGPKVLFETCSCSHELLKSVVTFLNGLVEDVNHVSQWTQHERLLLRESLLLLHKINIHDQFFDTHRESCEHGLTFVLNTLSWLLKTTDPPMEDEVVIVNELLECCEELDDSSHEDSSEENHRPAASDKDKMDTN